MSKNRYSRYRRRKIKHSNRRLYKKKKSTKRKVAEVILMLVLIGGLVFLGYCVAEPLMSYFRNSDGEPDITSWTPEQTTPAEELTTTPPLTEATTAPAEEKVKAGIYLPNDALLSSSAFTKAIKDAKSDGASEVYILMKDTDGYLLYSSQGSAKNTDLIKGTMSLGEIVGRVRSEGVTPVAVINTLLDNMTPGVIEGTAYRWADDSYTWLDAAADKGGKRWVDPFKSETADYFCELIDEITSSGIKKVVLKNTVFPDFLEFDKTILDAHFFDEKARADALKKLLGLMSDTARKNGAELFIEINACDGFTGLKTAEALFASDSSVGAVCIYNSSDFSSPKLEISGTEITLPTNQADKIALVFSRLHATLSGRTLIPVINDDGLASDALSSATEKLSSQGLHAVIK